MPTQEKNSFKNVFGSVAGNFTFPLSAQAKFERDFDKASLHLDHAEKELQLVAKFVGVEVVHGEAVNKTLNPRGLKTSSRVGNFKEIFEGKEKNKASGETTDFGKEDSFETPALGVGAALYLAGTDDIVVALVNFGQENGNSFRGVLKIGVKFDEDVCF